MKKKFVRLISAVLSAAMTLTAVPLSAFAEGEAHTHDGESNVITTPLDFREKKADENGVGWSWDYDTKTLTLDEVNIQATTDSMSVVTVPDGTEIVLNGNNTIVQTDTGDSYTYILSAVNTNDVNCDGTMTISGEGVLNAENRSTDSMARSLGGSIIINGGTVNATGKVVAESLEIHNDGALNAEASAVSNDGAAVGVKRGITVDGNGSLTAVGGAVENEYANNGAILLNSNFGDKISVSGNGSITVPEGNAARVGIYYDGNKSIDAEISGGKVTAYGTKCGIYKVNLIMSGTGSVYATGGTYGIGQTVPTIDEDEFVVKGSTEFKAEESSVTANAEFNSGYYEIGRADAKTVVIKPDTSPRIILGNQIGIFKTEEYEIIEDMDMTDIKLKGTVYFDITLKNMSDEEFADARGCFGGDEPDLLASIIKTDYGWVCMVCDTEFSVTYDTDNTLTIKCGDIVSNTVQVKSNANRFNKVTQGDNTNRTVFYTNTSQEEKDNYKLVSTYTVDSESISYNWYSTNSAYSADELGAAVSGSNGEFKLADNIPAGNYVLYCDITYSDGDSTETVTEKFTFTYKECAHENGYSDGKCTNCGALCDHSNIDIDTGKCNECAHQFVATISTDGNAPTGYDTLADCLNSVTADTENYVKIYQDIGDASATATLDTIDVKHNVMIDLNGHKLNNIKLGVNKLGVNKDVTLTLTGTAGSYVTQVYVRKGGGSFIIDSEANVEFNTIFVEDSARLAVNDGAKVTTEQLTVIASVNDDGTTTTSVKLATGMKLGGLTYHRQNNSGALKLGNLLDVTRQALRREDNGNYLDLYKEYGSMGYSVALTVVEHTDADHKYSTGTGKCEECGKPCEHGGDINTDTGICSICGAVVSVAIYTDANGISKYVDTDELHSLLNEYNGSGTIKLFKDYDNSKAQYDLYGELTIDLNGRRLNIRSITPCKNGKLTIKNSGNPVMLGCNVYPTNDASYAGGTLIIDGDVVLDTSIYVYDSSTVILKDGTYPAGLYARDSKTLYDMLGEGKAFFKTDGTLFNASVKEISSSVTLIVKDHSHTYVDGKCGCGYVCTHSDVDSETGKCTECEYQYAAVIVKDGAAASVYKETEMEAAFETADSEANTGCTLRVYKNYTGSYTTLSGKFTLWIAEKANVGTLTVSGDITVTGSGKNNRIYGDFNVAAGGKLTFDEKCGAMGTVSVGAGTFDCYSTFSITLNINDASSDVILHGGAFKTICYNGGGDRANAEILTLLAENRMFMKSPNPEPIDGSKTLLKDGFATPVIVIPHEGHSYDSTTGKCTICGKRCGHTDVDSKTGVCSVCEYQLTAGISGVGTAKYFDNIDDAFTAALSEVNNGCTLTLYKHCEITQNVEIGNTTVTVDVNGCSLGGEADISVNNSGVLYLKDSRKSTYYGCIDAPFSVNGGTLINGTADGGSSAADVLNLVINSAKRVEIYGGIFENVYIAHASGVALYGGRYNTICGEESNSTPVNALLAKGYAFAILNSVTHLPESIVDGSAKTIGGRLTNVMVVAHEHRYNVETGKCPCGVCALAIFTETTQSSETYTFIESETQFKNIAENEADGVLKLTGDVDCIVKGIIINGNKTIDMNGHTLNVSIGTEEISAVAVYGNVTFENSGSSRAVINATGVYSYGMVTVNGDIEFDTFATFEDGDALINAGVFKSIYVQGRSVIEILGSGKALASESGEILNASVQQIYKAGDNIFVTAHPKHTYDEHGNCACGYKCLHDGEGQVDEDSANKVCSECGAKIYAKVTTADGKVKYFDDITEGLRYADKAENKGCVFTLVTSGKLEDGVKLSSGKFTITANDYVTIYETADGRGIIIEGADVIAEGHMSINCDIYVNSGSFTLPEGSSTRFGDILIFGGNVNISEGVNADNNAGADNLIIANDATDAKVTIGGGTYGRIVFGQLKLKDVLASGARVIRYDNSSDSTAEKTATALLYSDIAEKNNFDSENNTVSYYLFTKCEHKNEDGSYAFNEGGICKYCNSEFAASVSYTADGGEKTELFSDICDAFDKANEIGTATVTLYKDITDSERTQEITVMGNVTLELNGKTLGGRYGIARISVSDGGTLTVNGDGDMDTPIYVNENSKLVINGGGYFNSVSVKKGGNAEIGGGTIRGLSVRGNVKLSGGKFNDIEIFNGNLESVLADGYAYKVEGGEWLSIAERAESVYSSLNNNDKPLSVEEAPIKSATATANKTVLYRNGGGARQILFNFNVNTSDGYTISDANKVTVGLYVGDTLIRESDFGGNSYTFANADEISDTDGTVKAHLVIKLNGYEYVTDDVEFEIATCTHPYDALTTDEHDYYRCSLCDASINAILVKTNGDKACYTDNVPEAFEAAQLEENNGCTLELYRGVNRDCEITQGSFTVLFKKTGSASAVIKVSGGNVKITGDDGCTLSKYPGSSVGYLIAVTGGTVTFDDITINDDSISVSGGKTVINGGTYNKLSVSGGTVTINSGTFSSIDVSAEGKALKDLLGENKAFTTSDGKLFDASKVSESDMSLTVIDHSKHEYDEKGRCGCGYQCAHSEINAEGVCNECNAKMYAAVTVKSETGTTVKYFTKLTEAFEFAAKNENKGCTLKMLRDFFDRNTDINVNGGKLTVDMNGFGVYFNSFNGSGTQITIRSDSKCTFGVENGFSMDGGTVTFSGEVSVVCQNVKLNATYFSSYVETLKIDTLILEDGVLLKQLASITNANIANIDCSSEIYLYQILASGSRVDSQLYSDLKANASSNFDNVRIIRCDHPDGVGRDNRCIYCNSLIAASVSYTENGAEKTEYFVKEDLGKAFAKANSVAIATITMLMSSAYDTDYLPVTGDVTLIANGDNAILYNTVKVADGGKLTLRGNANIFAVIAEPGSRLTAEEATRIAYLTVNGGDVKLSGGQYDNITVKDGKITDILGNGYAYKKTEGGAWLTLKEREVSEASGVTVAKAPIVQATLSTEINKLYRNSNANPTLKFNLALAHGSNLNDSYVSKRYGINSYVSGDIIYSSLSALVKDAKLSADEIIDKAGNSVAAKIYFVVITDDGYEIKSNTVSIDLVDCDHSQVVDPTADKETAGNITEPTYCEICESKFNAKITKGDDVRYYNNLDEAAKDAQKSENEGCTLYPLYNKNGYGGQLVITEGNFTLKYAVRTAFSRPIIINGKAKLTVTGRCAVTAFENQDAFIVQGGDVTFEGLATGSNVTINGGNVTMAANNINCLTINGGNVSISSGGFAKIITNVGNKVIADYIDPGFWVQDRGTKEWIDIYSLNKATASSTNGLTVRLCPMQIIKPIDTVYYTNGYYPDGIPSLQISAVPWYSGEVDANVAYQWIAIDENGNETEIEGATDRKLSLENLTTGRYYCRLTYSNAATAGVSMKSDVVTATITECEHSGGEATCTKKAKCEICGAEYGEPLGHDYVVIKVVEPDYRNEGYSVFECTRCKDSYIGNRVPVKPIPDVEEIAVEKTTYNEVDISWKNISGVDGYYVECYVGNQWKQIGFSTDGDRVAAKLSGLSAGLKYKVRIAAYAGRFTAKFRCFYVDTVPSPVWNINTVKATDETVRISWSRNARADGYKVEWYINNQWSVKTVTGNNNISAVIDGLCAGTRYKVRVSAYKGDLYSPYTYGYIDTLPSKVTGITKTVTSSSFTLKWDKNESADGYTAQYYADGKWNEKTLTGNNKTTVTIGSLKGYKTYKVRIKAYKGELESAFDDIYITTAPTKVSGLKVKSAVDSKAVVIWNADANADGYNVEYYIGGKWVKKTITDNKTAKAVLGGLTPYITYKVRVRAYKDNLYGDYSYTTVTAVLSPVTNIKVVSAKRNSITVKWGKNASADGYKVEIYKGGKWVKKTLKGSTNATVTIGGLRAGSVYKVRIASYKGANTSTYTYANVKTAK